MKTTITVKHWMGKEITVNRDEYIKAWTDSLYSIRNFSCDPEPKATLNGHISEIERIIEKEADIIFQLAAAKDEISRELEEELQ